MNQWSNEPQAILKISVLEQKNLSLLLVILCSALWKEFDKSLGETSKIKIKTTLLIQGNFYISISNYIQIANMKIAIQIS